MMDVTRPVKDLAEAMEAPPRWVRFMARLGYGARGVIYLIVGGLAGMAALGFGGAVTGMHGAMRREGVGIVGVALLVVLVLGFGAHATWCLIQAAVDPEERARARRSPDEAGAVKRVGYRVSRFFEAVVHVGLVVGAAGLITGHHGTGGGRIRRSNAEHWTAWLMSWPLGAWLVGMVGAGVVGFGVFEVLRACREKLDVMLALEGLSRGVHRTVRGVSRFGIAARGVVFAMIGVWLIWAAWDANPREAKGLGAALRDLQQRAWGPGMLGVAAAGLVAYGGYEFVRAGWRRIGGRKG